jgi:hypothetical protein
MDRPSPVAKAFRRSAFLLTGLALFLVAAAAPAQPIRVLDAEGKPVAGAQVEARGPVRGSDVVSRLMPPLFAMETGADGSIAARLPKIEGILLLVDHPGFAPWTREMGGEPFQGTIRLSVGAPWSGKVSSPGKTYFKGEVCASWSEDFVRWSTKRAWKRCAPLTPAGTFALAGLPLRTVDVAVAADGFLPLRRSLKPGTPIELHLEPGIVLRGKATGPTGQPVAGATIVCQAGCKTESGSGGDFRLSVRALPVSLRVEAPGFRAESLTVAKAPKPPGLLVRLRPAEQLAGRVVGDGGQAISEAELRIERLLDEGGKEWESKPLRSPTGDFRVDLPGPGRYRLAVRSAGYREERLGETAVAPGQAVSLGEIALKSGSKVVGVLVDQRDGRPLAGVEVALLPQGTQMLEDLLNRVLAQAVSAEDGSFTLSGLTSGRYEIRARRAGFAPGLARFTLGSDRTEDLGRIALEPGATLRGRLVDRAGKPRPGLIVRVFDPEQSSLAPLAEQTTGEDGVFHGPSLAVGRYRLQILGSRLLLSEEIEVPSGAGEVVLDRVVGGVHLQGVVTRGGEPVSGGFVSLSQALDPGQFRGKLLLRTSESERPEGYGLPETAMMADVSPGGTFDVPDAPPGLLWASYVSDGGEDRTRRLLVPDQETALVTLEIGGLDLRGRVEEAGTGLGIAASLQLSDPSGRPLARMTADADGLFALPGLEPGAYTLRASADDFITVAVPGLQLTAESPPVRIPLERGKPGELTVRLRREDGTPISGVLATLLDASGAMVRSLPTDALGERRFEDLPGGVYFLVWMDAASGTGASGPISLDGRRPVTLEKVLPEGAPVQLTCDATVCGGAGIDFLGLYSADGLEIAPYLSGVASSMRFSQTGRISLGRITPGEYVLRVWMRGAKSERPLVVSSQAISVPMF